MVGLGLIFEVVLILAFLYLARNSLNYAYYQKVDGELVKWCEEYTDQDEVMIHSDKILTLVEPNEKYFDMYSEAIGGFK